MIVRPRPRVFELFLILKGSTLPTVAPQVFSIGVFAFGVVWLERHYFRFFHTFNPAPFTLLGIALSIFLGFRNNACYDRWWEARKLWGSLINETRALSRSAVTLLPKADAERSLRMTIAYVYCLAAFLRRKEPGAEARTYIGESADAVLGSRSATNAILREMGREYARLLKSGAVTDIIYKVFDERMVALAAIQGACERIRNTPVPFAYTLLLHKTAYLFCLLLPFSLVGTFGYAAPVFCIVVAYAFFGLDALGDELEDPFKEAPHGLPLNALARTIEIDMLEALGERDLPEPLLPVDYLLM